MKFAFMCREPGSRRGRVAVIGAGVSGLAATGHLSCQGYEVDVYDKLPYAGGTMMFVIPTHKIAPDSVIEGVEDLRDRFSVKFFFRTKVFKDGQSRAEVGDEYAEKIEMLENIIENYDAVLISTGAWRPNTLNVSGLRNVSTAFEYLYSWRLYEEGFSSSQPIRGRKVAIIGADLPVTEVIRKLLGQGAEEIYVLYNGRISEAPMGWYWVANFSKEGVEFIQHVKIERIVAEQGFAKALEFTGANFESPQPLFRIIDVDLVIASLGSRPSPPILEGSKDIEVDEAGRVVVDKQFRTGREKIYASGSVVLGLIYRLGKSFRDGLEVAKYIDQHIYRKKYM